MTKIELRKGSPEYHTIINMLGKLAAVEITARAAITKYGPTSNAGKVAKRILELIDNFPPEDSNNDTETK